MCEQSKSTYTHMLNIHSKSLRLAFSLSFSLHSPSPLISPFIVPLFLCIPLESLICISFSFKPYQSQLKKILKRIFNCIKDRKGSPESWIKREKWRERERFRKETERKYKNHMLTENRQVNDLA